MKPGQPESLCLGGKPLKIDYYHTPRLAAGTKPMGFPKGRSGSSPLWSTAGSKPHGRYNLSAGIGTGGTIMGSGRFLKEMNPKIRVIAVEPDDALHGLEGLKHMATSITPGIYHEEELDEKIPVGTEDAYAMVYRLSQEEGVLVGQSSGAAMHITLQVAKKLRAGTLVTVFPDFGDKYLTSNLWVGWRHQMLIGNQKFSI